MSGGMSPTGGFQQPMPGGLPNPYVAQQAFPGAPQVKLTEDEKRREKRRHQREEIICRKREEFKKDADCTVMWMTYGSMVNGILLLIPVTADGWGKRQFTGLGLKMFHISTSLFHINIDIECGKNWLEDKLCHFGTKMNGMHSLDQASQMACEISTQACNVMTWTVWATYVLLMCFGLAIVCNFLAAAFLHTYWWHSKLPKLRSYALFCFAAGPALVVLGFAGWNLTRADLSQLPQGLTAATKAFAGAGPVGELFTYKPVKGFPYGWPWIFTIFLVGLQGFIFSCWPLYFSASEDEEAALEAEEAEEDRIEEELFAQYLQQHGYGTVTPGIMPNGGTAQPMGAGNQQWGAPQ